MKKYIIWLYLECKKGMKVIPVMLIGAIVLVFIISTIAFIVHKVAIDNNEMATIGVVIEDENQYIEMFLNEIVQMDSIASFFEFSIVDIEQGKKGVEDGTMIALVVLPEGLISGILTGRNIPAQVYFSGNQDYGLLTNIAELLLKMSVEELQIAQAQIYAMHDLKELYGISESLSELELAINMFNLNFLMYRENIFQERDALSVGVLPLKEQIIAALLAFYSMITGLYIYGYVKGDKKEIEEQLYLYGISYPIQTMVKIGIINLLVWVNTMIGVTIVVLYDKEYIQLFNIGIEKKILILVANFFISCIIYLVYRLGNEKKNSMIIYLITVVLFSYLSGIFIPSSLLALGSWTSQLPSSVIKEIWLNCFYIAEIPADLWGGLIIWLVVLVTTIICVNIMIAKMRRNKLWK